jgi:hypothetical protein
MPAQRGRVVAGTIPPLFALWSNLPVMKFQILNNAYTILERHSGTTLSTVAAADRSAQ